MHQKDNDLVLYEQAGAVAIITLNRPEAYNALSKDLVKQLIVCFNTAENDDTVHAIVLTGNGKAFSAGVDLKELSHDSSTLIDDSAFVTMFNGNKKPVIGAINGFAITGALELALNCDVLYASENAVFADTHSKVGIMPTWGMSQKLPRLIGMARAKEMSLSGRKIDAKTALDWGLINRIYPSDKLLEKTIELAKEISANDPKVVKGMKELMDSCNGKDLKDAIAIEYKTSHLHNDNLDYSGMLEKLNQLKKTK